MLYLNLISYLFFLQIAQMAKPLFPEDIASVSTSTTIHGRVVRVSDEVSTRGDLTYFNFTIRGHDGTWLSCSAFNMSKRFPLIRAMLGHVVEVTKMAIRLNKRKYLRFGKFSGRYVETSTINPLPDDVTIGTDCPPLHGNDDDTDDDDGATATPSKRTASGSVQASQANPVTQTTCINKCTTPSSLVCAKTGALHPTVDTCAFCAKTFNDDEPFCTVKVGYTHQKPVDLTVISSFVAPSDFVQTSY